MFSSDSQRRAAFANMAFARMPTKKVVTDIISSGRDYDVGTHLGSAGVVRKPDVVYGDITGNDGVSYVTYDEIDNLDSDSEYVPVGKSLSDIEIQPVSSDVISTLDEYFERRKDDIESSAGIPMSGSAIDIQVVGEKLKDIRPKKDSNPRDVVKFSKIPGVSKGVFNAYMAYRPKKNPFGEVVEGMVLYPGALDKCPTYAFDEDWNKFNSGKIFNSYGTTDWKDVKK